MTALDKATPIISKGDTVVRKHKVSADAVCYAGGIAMRGPTGGVQPAEAIAGNFGCVGIFAKDVDNTGGALGDLEVEVLEGTFKLPASSIADTNVGQVVYAVDDATIDDGTASNRPRAGLLDQYEASTSGWVRMSLELAQAMQATDFGDSTLKWKKIAVGTGSASEADSGWDLPAKAVVHHVFVEVTTAEATGATKTLDVGLLSSESGGDADGFLDGVSVATTGLKKGVFASTAGSNNTYVGAAATHTRGALLTELLLAGNDVANGGDGVAVRGEHLSDAVTAKSLSYTRGSVFSEFAGYIWIGYSTISG